MARRRAIKGFGKRLARDGGQVHRPPAEVDDLLGVSLCPAGVGSPLTVTGVGRRGRVAALHRRHEAGIADRASKSAISNSLETAVPALARQPHLEGDARVRRGMEDTLNPAKGGKLHGSSWSQFWRDHKGSGRLDRRGRDLGIGKGPPLQSRTVSRPRGPGGQKGERQSDAVRRQGLCSHLRLPNQRLPMGSPTANAPIRRRMGLLRLA